MFNLIILAPSNRHSLRLRRRSTGGALTQLLRLGSADDGHSALWVFVSNANCRAAGQNQNPQQFKH